MYEERFAQQESGLATCLTQHIKQSCVTRGLCTFRCFSFSSVNKFIACNRMHCIYMEIDVHKHTLALRNQKEKKGEVTHPTIAQTNKHI